VPQSHVARVLNDAPGICGDLEFWRATNLVSEGRVRWSFSGAASEEPTQLSLSKCAGACWIPYSQDFHATTNLTFAPGQTSNAFIATIMMILSWRPCGRYTSLKDSN